MSIIPALITAVEKVAPGVATALGSPVAGIVVSLLEQAFGVKAEALPAAIAADPDAVNKLQELQLHHGEVLAQLASTDYATEVDDRKNARAMAVDNNDWVIHFLAVGYLIGFFAYTLTSLIPGSGFDKGIFHDLLNVAMLIFSFYFGSSYRANK